jgi:2,3,4,5-tetrahydropyridine-2-carboxylate N-succinyltransferase
LVQEVQGVHGSPVESVNLASLLSPVNRVNLEDDINTLIAAGASADRETARTVFARLRDALSAGSVRAAEPDSSSPIGWRVNTWVKQGILLGFRFGDTIDMSMDHGRWPFFDKDTLPMKRPALTSGIRIVPGGSSVRDGAYIGPGVICVPPMFVNIGAWIGERSLIDSHALVGSCAQIGAGVHISAGAQIGGVIEPVGALPVIVEDDALIGGNTGLYEGAIVRTRAVIAAGTVLTGSTPVYDLVRGEIIKPTKDLPLVIPEGAVVVPGARAVSAGKGPEWGLSLSTPVIVKYRDSRTDTRTELEAWIR